MIGHDEWRKYAVVGDARQAAKRVGIAVEPNLPKETLVLVYLEEVERPSDFRSIAIQQNLCFLC